MTIGLIATPTQGAVSTPADAAPNSTTSAVPMRPPPPRLAEMFRAVPAAVCVVTTAGPGGPMGLTVSSLCSVSEEPPLLLICLDRRSRTLTQLLSRGAFGFNLLSADDHPIADLFAGDTTHRDRFAAVRWVPVDGIPLLCSAVTAARCRIRDVVQGGDHTIVIAAPETLTTAAGTPLLRYRRRYGRPDPL